MIRKIFIIFLIVFSLQYPAFSEDLSSQVTDYINSKEARITYNSVTHVMLEAQNLVKPLNQAYAAVLLGSPDSAVSLIGGGIGGLALNTSKSALIKATRELLGQMDMNPAVTARRIADANYQWGIEAYRKNYETVKAVKKGKKLSESDAKMFLNMEKQIEKMTVARKLISDINSHEYDSWNDVNKKAQDESIKTALTILAKIESDDALLGAITIADLIKKLNDVFSECSTRLENFPPYAEYLSKMKEIESKDRYNFTSSSIQKKKMKDGSRYKNRMKEARRKGQKQAWDRDDIGELAQQENRMIDISRDYAGAFPNIGLDGSLNSYGDLNGFLNDSMELINILLNTSPDNYDEQMKLYNSKLSNWNNKKNGIWENFQNDSRFSGIINERNLSSPPDLEKIK